MSKTSNPTTTTRRTHLFTCAATMCLVLTVLQSVQASEIPTRMSSPYSTGASDTIHSIQVNKSLTSKKSKIKLFPDARQQVLFFSVNGDDKRVYQLYLFDMDGRLVSQASIRNRETTVLTALAEGNYLFEVFTDDERIENGHLVVR